MENYEPFQLIGIHNGHPSTLYIQFSIGERYFIYKRDLFEKRETIREQFFENTYIERAIEPDDELYLMGKLQFLPQTKRAISNYRF